MNLKILIKILIFLGISWGTIFTFLVIVDYLLVEIVKIINEQSSYDGFSFTTMILITLGSVLAWLALNLERFYREPKANEGMVILNDWTKKQRGIFEGFNLITVTEKSQYTVDLQTELEAKIDAGTYPTKDGAVLQLSAAAIVKPDIGGDEGEPPMSPEKRSANLVKYKKFRVEAIQGMVLARLNRILSDVCSENVAKAIKDNQRNFDFFGTNPFMEIERLCAVKVVKSITEDVDYDEATQKSRAAINRAESFRESMKELLGNDPVTGKPYITDEKIAAEINMLLNDLNYKKISLDLSGGENFKNLKNAVFGAPGMFGDDDKKGGKGNKGKNKQNKGGQKNA